MAADDLAGICRYIRTDNPQAARDVARAVFDALQKMKQFPLCGRAGRKKSTRSLYWRRHPIFWFMKFGKM
jgi:plasmid stabilization system protein ParE